MLDGIGETDFYYVHTFMQIMDRNRGSNTPIEDFLRSLILVYECRDIAGSGMTLEDVESEIEELKDNLRGTIETAHFIAARYPLPHPDAA